MILNFKDDAAAAAAALPLMMIMAWCGGVAENGKPKEPKLKHSLYHRSMIY